MGLPQGQKFGFWISSGSYSSVSCSNSCCCCTFHHQISDPIGSPGARSQSVRYVIWPTGLHVWQEIWQQEEWQLLQFSEQQWLMPLSPNSWLCRQPCGPGDTALHSRFSLWIGPQFRLFWNLMPKLCCFTTNCNILLIFL